jgi:UDP-N-acetylglucosamine--N-acetylmuramyl-(pentapeptide) pyrophosphoryl-undecaprenol N-acetylglucosamine transferase
VLVPFPQAADRHQDANAVCAAAVAAAVIVHQHDPSETTLRDTVWRLLGSRLQRGDSDDDPLPEMGQAMRELGVEDADQKLVALLEGLVAEAR